jgi:hypothetical protein
MHVVRINVNTTRTNQNGAIVLLATLHVLLGLNGLVGGGAFLLAPDGHLLRMPFSHIQRTPFPDFFIPGLLLFLFLGIMPLLVAHALWRKPAWARMNAINPWKQLHWSRAASFATGMAAMIWILVQILWIPAGLLHLIIFTWGAVIAAVTFLPGVREHLRMKE